MKIGNRKNIILEDYVSKYYASPSEMALGYFNVHLYQNTYGVLEKDASLLASSYNEITSRIKNRGQHRMPFADEIDAAIFIQAFNKTYLGHGIFPSLFHDYTEEKFLYLIFENKNMWIPDGDAAFDDGSYIFHFDLGNRVRLIGFKNTEVPSNICDLELDADEFYGVLERWAENFHKRWEAATKTLPE